MINRKSMYVLYLITLVICGCSPLISKYDQYAYTQTTSLKIDALNLMGEATEDYKLHEKEVKLVSTNIQKLIEYDKHLYNNKITLDQWSLLTDTTGNLFGGFIKEWKTKGTLKSGYIPSKQEQVARGFDEIIKLEINKLRN